MPTMTKRVNIRTTMPVRNVTPPINGTLHDVIMTTGDVLKCLSKRAIVDEILPDGSTVRLTMRNYYTDNGAGLYVSKESADSTNKKVEKKKPELKIAYETIEEVENKNSVNNEKVPEMPVENEAPINEVPVVETEENNIESNDIDNAKDIETSSSEENVSERKPNNNSNNRKHNGSRKK